jgi:hypothetical protein
MELVDIKNLFRLRIEIPELNEGECKEVLGCDLGIKKQPIRKVVQFRESVQGQPISIWRNKWMECQ